MLRYIFPLYVFCIFLSCSLLTVSGADASTTQYGDTGLLSQPTAQTLNEGNICVGLWTNCSDGVSSSPLSTDSSVVVPASITMGLGTFMEVYGSYPNLLFNGDEDGSGRGYANAGFKFRVFGKRSDSFRLALDVQGRRTVSDDLDYDGLTDYVSRFVTSYSREHIGFHFNAGYALNDSPHGIDYDDQIVLGGGVEYSLATRLRLIAEYSYETEKISGEDAPSEATLGFKYFITPHLTMNLGASIGMSDASPDWRILMGMSTCQGIGTFNRPVPKLVDPFEEIEEPVEPVKLSKVRALTPLLTKIAIVDSPISHLEVPVYNPDKAFIVDPSDRLEAPGLQSSGVSPLDPVRSMGASGRTSLPDQPFPAKVRRHFRFPELTYALNQWDLSEEGRKSISMVAEELRKEKKFFILSIEGHTDDVGSETYNRTLSFKRAVAAATHLVLRDGFDPARIFVKGYGESRPIEDNNKNEGRARNRRVELLILVPEGYEHIDNDPNDGFTRAGNREILQQPVIDSLAIEQAIMEKTGAETAKPAGTFSRIEE